MTGHLLVRVIVIYMLCNIHSFSINLFAKNPVVAVLIQTIQRQISSLPLKRELLLVVFGVSLVKRNLWLVFVFMTLALQEKQHVNKLWEVD